MRTVLSVAFVVVTVLAVGAQEPPAQPAQKTEANQPPSFRSRVDLLAVDVSVVDRNGRPVENLTTSDFVVKVDGVERQVVSADLVKVDAEAARKEQVDKAPSFYTSNLTPPNGRQIVLAIDQTKVGIGSLRLILDAASKFLDRLSPFDQVALAAYPEPGVRVDFTNDKTRIRQALQRLVGRLPRSTARRHSIGVSEARSIVAGLDEHVYASVVDRECPPTRNADENDRCLREVDQESREVAQEAQEDADNSQRGLRVLLEQLAQIEGPKQLVLLSEGFLGDDIDLRSFATLAGEARTSINALVVDPQQVDVTTNNRQPTAFADRRQNVQSLEGLAVMSRGGLFRISGSGEAAFARLTSEMSAYYTLGVEPRVADGVRDRRRIEVEVRRRDVTVRSRQAFVLSPARLAARARELPETALREALGSPFAVSGLPLRVTTFAQPSPGSNKVRLVVAAQVGESGAEPGTHIVGFLLVTRENQIAGSFLERMTLSSVSSNPNEPLRFVGGVLVDPGTYSLRFAVVDKEGRRGSVVREVTASKMAGEPFAVGDLIVGPVPAQGTRLAMQVEPAVGTDGVAASLELYSTTDETWMRTTVAFEIANSQDAPALGTVVASVEPGRQPTWRVASGVVTAPALPPGRYVVRARIARDGKNVGTVVRPFVLDPTVRPDAALSLVAPAALRPPISKFDRAIVFERDLLDDLLTMVERRGPDLKAALVEARAGRYEAAALAAFNGGDLIAGSFLSGVDLFAKGELTEAAARLRAAGGPRGEFFPAAVFLGACFAAVGRDQDAAGVWQLALGKEPRPAVVYTLAADARLRAGQPQSAIDILKPVHDRDPAQDAIGRRLAIAYASTGRHVEALTLLDEYLRRRPTDPEMLFAAIVSQYEAVRGGQILSSLDRDKVLRYAAAYEGPNRTLVDTYLEALK